MTIPAWNDASFDAGGMIKVSLWLMQSVKIGNVFTKEDLRRAFPGVSQIDRRLRDLRAFDWIIHSNTQDVRLSPQEQRFVRQGVPVWDPVARRNAERAGPLSAKDRQAALARDGFMCTLCGVFGGEPYADDPSQTAVLNVRRRVARSGRENDLASLVTECKRCSSGGGGPTVDVADAIKAVGDLDPADQRRLRRWIERGRRGPTQLDTAWGLYRKLSADAQGAVRVDLGLENGTQ